MNTPHEKDLRILDHVAAVCRPQDASALRRIAARLMELEDPSHEPVGYVVRDKDGKLIKNHRGQIVLSNEKGSAYKFDYDAGAVDVPIYLAPPAPAVPDVDAMVGAFLSWRLPDDFAPDAGISFDPVFNKGTQWEMRHEPIGTNLLNADQAKAMVLHMLAAAPQPPAVSDDKPEPDYKAMFHRAVTDIALIEEALGIPEEESGKSAHRLAEAAKELRRQVFSYESMVADRDEWLAKYGEVIKNAHEALVFATDRMMELTDDQYPIIEDAIDRAKNTIDAMREGDPS